MKYSAPQKQYVFILLSFVFIINKTFFSQTTGMIVEPATGAAALVLDPNSNGFVSATTAGFLGNDQLSANNELPWQTLIPAGSEPNSDVQNGPNCGFTDFVESSVGGIDPVFHLTTGGNWLFRFRMASIAPNAKSYSIMVDIDNLIGPGDDCYIPGVNPGFELEIVLATKFGVRIYDHRLPCGSNLIFSYGPERIQKSIAASTVCSQLNFFLETYVSWADITAQFGVDPFTPMRYAIVDNMAADKSTICNPSSASDIGGVDDNACGSLEACFTQIVNLQPPCPPNSISPCIYSACPVISGTPIAAGATSISGTSTEANGTVIRIFVNGILAGSGTVTGGSWTVSGLTPLAAGAQVSATAQATNEVESGTNCNNAQVAGATCTPPITSANHCGKSIQGIGLAGATIRVYEGNNVIPDIPGGGTIWTSGQPIVATTVPSALAPSTQNFLHKCTSDGVSTSCNSAGPACLVPGAYRITQQMPGQCESTPVWICVGGLTATAIPTISTTITTATTSVTGIVPAPDNIAGITVILYVDGYQVGSTTTIAGGNWTINSLSFAACDVVNAIAIKTTATAKCPSSYSISQTVSGGITSTPTVNAPLCGTTTSVSGTVNEQNGTQVQVFSNGVSAGTTTSAGGTWQLTGLNIPAGAVVTAQATNSNGCESVSTTSTGVTVATQTTNLVTITQNPLTESNLVISGTGTNGDLVTLFIDGWPLYKDFAETAAATATVSGGAWSVTLTQNTLYAGGVVTASVSNAVTCGSSLQDPTPVICTPPTSSLSVSPDNTTICSGSVVTNVVIQNTQIGVIYQLYNSTLTANSGTSLMGNGGNLTLSSAPISTNTTLSVLAIKSPYNGSCNQFLTENIPVTVALVPTLSFVSQTNPGCGLSNGNITISGLGNNLTYTVNYSINGTSTSGSFTSNASGQIVLNNLAGDSYSNISTTAFGCNSTNSLAGPFTLTAPIVPTVPTVTTAAATCSAAGTATISNYSGSLTYTFTPVGPTVGALGAITGMTAGTSYTVTAGNGSCTSIASSSFSIAAQLTTPSAPTVTTSAASCSAVGTATISGYNGALTYTFTPAGPTAGALGAITGMTAGTSYTVTAGNGSCTSAASSSFSIAAQLTIPGTPTVTTAVATCSAAGTATITNYDGGLTYAFSPSGPTVGALGAITGMTAGTSYTVTAGNGSCASAASSSFSVAAQFTTPNTPTVTTAAATCSAVGTATINGYNGALTYTFTPAGPTAGAGGAISGMTAGTSYTVTAGNGSCTSIASSSFSIAAQLTIPSTPTVTTAVATCSAAGTATITNYDGGLTYAFSPSGPTVGALGAITGMTAGTSYTVTAGNGSCASAASSSFSVAAQLTTPNTPTVTTAAATCSAVGTATINGYNGALTYTFTPVGPTAGAGGAISGMTAGTSYTVTAGNGSCTSIASSSFSIAAQLTIPSIPTVTTALATCSAAGTATITNYDGGLTYAFSPSGPTAGALGAITGMTAGTSYTVTAGNGSCTSAASSSFSIAAQLTTPSVPTVSTAAATCSAAGTASISGYNGALTYTFTPAGPTAGALGAITGMTAGTSYTVTAGNGSCTSTASSAFSIAAQLTTPSVPTVTTAAATCSGDGTATISNYSGTLTYTFSPSGPTAGALGAITGMTAGTSYTVTAGNGSCASAASSSFSVAAQLTTPNTPTVTTSAATCSAVGTATITNYDGGLTYAFSPSGPTAGALGAITGMTAGTSYTVIAGNGSCTSIASSSFSIAAQLTTPTVPTVTTAAATCSVAGTASISGYNGALTYTFTPSGPTAGALGAITGMTAGTSYTLTAGNGSCTSIVSSSFSIAAQLTIPTTPTVTTTAATCSAAGTATITNYNGGLTYAFSPSGPTAGALGAITGMTAGTSYTVTAGNGSCTSTASSSFSVAAQLTTPSVPTVSAAAATCSAAGTATITNYSGTLTYTFTPAGPTAGALGAITGMTAGTSYTVTAGNGSCTSIASSSFSIAAQLTIPSTPAVSTAAATCSVAGTATISNYNAGQTYTFTPSGPTAGAGGAISGMTAGTNYTVTTTNASTCTSVASSSFSIASQLTTPSVPTVTTTAATCSAVGTATISNYNAGQTYTFTPSGPTAGAGGVITGMTAGTSYTVTAGNGSCASIASSSFSIAAQLTTPSVPTVSTAAATCSAAGTATITNYSGSLTYTFSPSGPSAGAGGVISGMSGGISYILTAGNISCTSAASSSFSIAVPLCGPTANDNSTTTNEDTPVVLTSIQSNDTDSDGNVVTSTIDLDPTTPGQQTTLTTSNGIWTLNTSTGDVSFTPSANFNGTATISYTIQDNSGLTSNAANLTVTVNAINDTPNAVNDVTSTNEDTSVVIDVTNNDTDTDGSINDASVTVVSNPTNGTVTVNPITGEVTYTPNAGFNGTDSFTYSVCDNGTPLPALCDQATVNVTINAVNDAPNAIDDVASTNEDTPVLIDVTNNDTDTDGSINDASVTVVSNPTNGTVTVNPITGEVTYTPNAGFNGTDSFTYSVCDNGTPLPVQCDQATVNVTINAVNDTPNAVDDVASTNEDTPVVIDVTNNDTDTDGSINDASVTVVSNPTNGTTTVNPITGEVTYTPNAGFNGTDSFTYSVCDNGTPLPAQCDQATVNITVNAVNDSPIVDNDSNTIPEDGGPATGDLTDAGDSDPDGTPLTVDTTPVSGPNNGSITINSDGTYSYTPNAGFNGQDTIIVSVCDSGLPLPAICVNDTLIITVTPVNDSPIVDNDSNTISEDGGPATGDLTDAGDSDPDGTPLTVDTTPVSGPSNGSITINSDGTYSYTPNAGFNGQDTIIVSVCDNGLPLPAICVNDTLIITVTPVNDAPNATADNITTNENITVTINVTNNDNDSDGNIDESSLTITDQPTNGSVTVNTTTGQITYTPNSGFTGTDTLIYQICDNGTPLPAVCDTAMVVITVLSCGTDLTADCDGDGVTNGEEIDPDGDGSPGPNGTNPSDPCSFNTADQDLALVSQAWLDADCDGDGASNGDEVDPDGDGIAGPNGTNPSDPCSFDVANQDLGSVSQAWLDADCDGDGVTNGDEVDPDGDGIAGPNGTNPSDPCSFDVANQDLGSVSQAWLDADCDGDGVTNGEEVDPDGDGIAGPNGTNPSDPCSFDVANQDLGSISQAWLDADCDGDGVTNGDEVDPDGDGIAGPNGTDPSDPCSFDVTNQDLGSVSQAWLDADCDGDGVTNGEEIDPDGDGSPGPNGTNPIDPCSFDVANQDLGSVSQAWLDADCDGDGVTNGEEVDPDGDGIAGPNGTDPSDPCSFDVANQDLGSVSQAWLDADCDGDGVTNGEEVDPDGDGIAGPNGTNPSDPCSFDVTNQDLGSVSQAWLDADCDGDGVTNGQEVIDGTDPNNPCSLVVASQTETPSQAWLDADCDGDGLTNGEEVSGGSNPFDPCDPNPCDSDITIPQAFTPDGDNTNDAFVIPGIENYPKNKLTIYNRWGNEVFFAEGYNNTWNGTANRGIVIGDAQLPTGTYYYILDLNGDGETIYKGYVYLKR